MLQHLECLEQNKNILKAIDDNPTFRLNPCLDNDVNMLQIGDDQYIIRLAIQINYEDKAINCSPAGLVAIQNMLEKRKIQGVH